MLFRQARLMGRVPTPCGFQDRSLWLKRLSALMILVALADARAVCITFPDKTYFREQWQRAPLGMEIEAVGNLEDFPLRRESWSCLCEAFLELAMANNPDINSAESWPSSSQQNNIQRAYSPFDPNVALTSIPTVPLPLPGRSARRSRGADPPQSERRFPPTARALTPVRTTRSATWAPRLGTTASSPTSTDDHAVAAVYRQPAVAARPGPFRAAHPDLDRRIAAHADRRAGARAGHQTCSSRPRMITGTRSTAARTCACKRTTSRFRGLSWSKSVCG